MREQRKIQPSFHRTPCVALLFGFDFEPPAPDRLRPRHITFTISRDSYGMQRVHNRTSPRPTANAIWAATFPATVFFYVRVCVAARLMGSDGAIDHLIVGED